jgi:hypothetical protein
MIGESSGVTTLINNERISRENQVQSEKGVAEKSAEIPQQKFSDVTSFSAEALVLSKRVVPAGDTLEDGQVSQPGRGQEENHNSPARSLDKRG